jgi:hypothetical protein
MNKEGAPFTARLKFPANSNVPAHWHSTIEHVTVISGVMNMGVGDKLDTSRTQPLGPGNVSIMQAGTHHFVWFDEETVLQLRGKFERPLAEAMWGICRVGESFRPDSWDHHRRRERALVRVRSGFTACAFICRAGEQSKKLPYQLLSGHDKPQLRR